MRANSVARRLSVFAAVFGLLLASGLVHAGSPAVTRGVQWLHAEVQSDGTLSHEAGSIATPAQARAETLVALATLDTAPAALTATVLGGDNQTTGYAARQLLAAIAGGQSSVNLQSHLVGLARGDGGWGLNATYAADALDTSLALRALAAAGGDASSTVAHALGVLADARNSDGGWGVNGQSSVYVTALAARAAAAWRDHYTTSVLADANAWLLAARDANHAFATTLDNAEALLALSQVAAQTDARAPLVTALESAQLADGSWADDPWLTALALEALNAGAQSSPDEISVRGHVVDGQTGGNFAGVTVTLSGPTSASQTTDAGGNFQFANLAPGAYTLSLTRSGYVTVTTTTRLSAGQALDFGTIAMLPETTGGATTATVKGVVSDAASGAPIAGASVSANATTVTTASDGSYEIAGLAPGPVTLTASATGYQSATGTGTLTAGAISLFSPQLRAGSNAGTPTASLHGVITDAATGDPIAAATITVSGDDSASAQTGSDGHYEITDLAPGHVQITVTATGYDGVGASAQLAGNTSVDFSPPLYPSGTSPHGANTAGVRGTVVDSTTGLPLAGVTVSATLPDQTTRQVTTDGSGQFLIDGIDQATVDLGFSLTGYASAQFSSWLTPLKTIDIGQVRLRPDGVLKLLGDLVVSRVDSKTLADTDPATLAFDGTLEVDLGNHGSAMVPAGVKLVAFADVDRDGAYEAGTDTLLGSAITAAAIAPQANATVDLPVAGTLGFRDAPVSVWVDAAQQVVELDETNNVGSSTSQCRLAAPPSTIEAKLKWAWHGSASDTSHVNVYGPAMVGHLTDDNGDGKYDENDMPTVVFPVAGGVLVAASGKDGHELWRRSDLDTTDYGSVAIADLDGDGASEVIVSNRPRTKLLALHHDGSLMWSVATGPSTSSTRDGIDVADLDQDGSPEILQGAHVFDAAGNLLWVGKGDGGMANGYPGYVSIAADVDPASPGMEVVAGRTLYAADGTILWNRTDISCDGFNGVADFGYPNPPQIVLVSCGHLYLLARDGHTLWETTLAGGGRGGPPTIGDFGGEGKPQIGVAGAGDYAVYGADGSIRWSAKTSDYSSNVTGSSAFDFLDNGRVEIIYGDEYKLRVYDGATGAVLWSTDNRSGTTLEYPVLADVDNDGHADIVMGANEGASYAGVRVFSAANGGWAPTRTIWNEHGYHVTNINDDGSVPRVEPNSWQHGNTYRLNAFPDHDALDGPDLTASLLTLTDHGTGQPVSLGARIGNGGQIANRETTVAFYAGDPDAGGTLIGSVSLAPLAAGAWRDVELPNVGSIPATTSAIYVVVDPDDHVNECDKSNNRQHIAYAAGNTLADLAVATDAPSYGPNAPVQLSGVASNRGSFAASLSVDLRIEDTAGNVVVDFGDEALGSVAAGAAGNAAKAWNTGTTIAGDYVLHGFLYDAGHALVGEDTAPFTITAGNAPALASHVATDRESYAPNDTVTILSRVSNTSSNAIWSNLNLAIHVAAPDGSGVFDAAYPIAQLRPGAISEFQSPQQLSNAPEGTYTVTQTVTDAGGVVLDTQYATYKVAATAATSAAISGTLVADPHQASVGSSIRLDATVRNGGSVDLADVPLTIRVVDPAAQTVLWSSAVTRTIAANGEVAVSVTWPSGSTPPGELMAILSADTGAGDTPLANDRFSLTAVAAKPVAVPASGIWALWLLIVAVLLAAAWRWRFEVDP